MPKQSIPKLKTILSDGRTGAGRAALDAAIHFGLPLGGWASKGTLGQEKEIRSRYQLEELPAIDPRHAILKNVQSADGTLIIAFGKLTALPQHALRMTLKHKKQLLGIDLEQYSVFEGASLVSSWLESHHIRTLFVTGNDESEYPAIYGHALHILQRTIELSFARPFIESQQVVATDPDYRAHKPQWPQTIMEAVERVLAVLSLKEKNTIARMEPSDLDKLHFTIGQYVRDEFGLLTGNEKLMDACKAAGKRDAMLPDEASALIVRELWRKLEETYRLRVIK
jgi:hypothetical protein